MHHIIGMEPQTVVMQQYIHEGITNIYTYTSCILLASLADQGFGRSGVIARTLRKYHQPKLKD